LRDRRNAVARTSGALTGVYGEGDDAPARLAVLRAGTNLEPPDCCVLLAADQTQGEVATFDDRLADVAAEHGLVVRR